MDWVEAFAPVVVLGPSPARVACERLAAARRLAVQLRDPDSGRHRIAFRSSPRWATTWDVRGSGACRRSPASRSLTARRSLAPWVAPCRWSLRQTIPGSPTLFEPASPRPTCTCASGTCATRWSDSLGKIRTEGADPRGDRPATAPRRGGVHRPVVPGAPSSSARTAAGTPRVSEC